MTAKDDESGEHEVVHVESKGTSYAFKCEQCGQPTLWGGERQGWEHHPELLTAQDDQPGTSAKWVPKVGESALYRYHADTVMVERTATEPLNGGLVYIVTNDNMRGVAYPGDLHPDPVPLLRELVKNPYYDQDGGPLFFCTYCRRSNEDPHERDCPVEKIRAAYPEAFDP